MKLISIILLSILVFSNCVKFRNSNKTFPPLIYFAMGVMLEVAGHKANSIPHDWNKCIPKLWKVPYAQPYQQTTFMLFKKHYPYAKKLLSMRFHFAISVQNVYYTIERFMGKMCKSRGFAIHSLLHNATKKVKRRLFLSVAREIHHESGHIDNAHHGVTIHKKKKGKKGKKGKKKKKKKGPLGDNFDNYRPKHLGDNKHHDHETKYLQNSLEGYTSIDWDSERLVKDTVKKAGGVNNLLATKIDEILKKIIQPVFHKFRLIWIVFILDAIFKPIMGMVKCMEGVTGVSPAALLGIKSFPKVIHGIRYKKWPYWVKMFLRTLCFNFKLFKKALKFMVKAYESHAPNIIWESLGRFVGAFISGMGRSNH